MSDNKNIQKGTVKNRTEETKDAVLGIISKDKLAISLAGIAVLHWSGIITIPFISGYTVPFSDIFKIIFLSIVLVYFLAWGTLRRILDKIFTKDWYYIALVDARGNVTGTWKTDPRTLDKNNDFVEYENGDEIHYREGIDVHGRRYALIRDLQLDKESDTWIVENIDDYPEDVDDDQIIADNEQLEIFENTVLDDAKEGYELRKALPLLRNKIRHEESKDITTGLAKALSGSSVDEILSNVVPNYKSEEERLADKYEKEDKTKKNIEELLRDGYSNNGGDEQ